MDDACSQDDGIDLIDRCWEVTQDQDKASKIEKAVFETQRDVKTEAAFMSYVEETQFSTIGKCILDATASSDPGLRDTTDAKLAESSCNKVAVTTTTTSP